MESLGAGVRKLSPTTICTARAFLAVAADARNGSLPDGELPWVDPEVSPGCAARSPERRWQSVLAPTVNERLGGGVQLLACDVGIAAHGREVCVTEVLGDQAGVAGGLAQPRRRGVAQRVCGYVLRDPGARARTADDVGEDRRLKPSAVKAAEDGVRR